MPYTMEDFRRDFVKKHLDRLTPEERLAGLAPEEILELLPPQVVEEYLERQQPETQDQSLRADPSLAPHAHVKPLPDSLALIDQIIELYRQEGIEVPSLQEESGMPATEADFRREYVKQYLHYLTPEDRLRGLSPEEVLKLLPRRAIELQRANKNR